MSPSDSSGAMLFYSARFFFDPTRPRAKNLFLYSLAYIPLLVILMLLNGPSGVWAF